MTNGPTVPEGAVNPETPTLTTPPSTAGEVIQQQASSQDYVILRLAVVGLILIAVIAIIGSLLLIRQNKEVQAGVTAIIAIASFSVGGLVTMLTRVPLGSPSAPTKESDALFGRRKV